MSYVAKTDWKHDDPVTEQDLNRWETGIKENTEKLGTVQEFALTTASGDAKESITNVNTATTVGLFLIGSTATGAPTTAVGLLYVWRRGSSHLLQEYWEISSNKRHHRTSTDNGATWTTWQTIANTDVATTSKNGLMSSSDKAALDNAQKVKLTLDNGTNKSMPGSDANLVTEPGFYVTSIGVQNTAVTYGTLLHINRGSTSKMQVQWANATGDTYVRSDGGTGWGTWKRLTDNSILGGVLLGNKLIDTQTATFVGKVSYSTTENPHIAAFTASPTSLLPPNEFNSEPTQNILDSIKTLDGSTWSRITNTNGTYALKRFSFNLIEHVQRTYGTIPGATTANKVAWLKVNISRFNFVWYGYGSSPAGNKANLSIWQNGAWTSPVSHNSSQTSSLQANTTSSSTIASRIDDNGFYHALTYADPSNGTITSTLNTDYVELQIELSTSIWDNVPKTWTNLALQNGAQEYASGTAPRYRKEGNMVTVQGSVKFPTSISSATGIGTLPDGFRPSMPISVSLPTTIRSGFSSARTTRWVVGSNGVISLEGVQDGYQANEWLPVTFSFVVG